MFGIDDAILGAVAGPLIGSAISAIGGFFSPKPKPQVVSNRIDFVQMRADAEKAGFNPLAVLRSGAAAGYGVSSASAAPWDPVGDAFKTFGSAISGITIDPWATEKHQMEMDLAKAQIKQMSREGVSRNGSLGGGGVTGSATQIMMPGGASLHVGYGGSTDANTVTNEYGELAEDVYGAGRMLTDIWHDKPFQQKALQTILNIPGPFSNGSLPDIPGLQNAIPRAWQWLTEDKHPGEKKWWQ